MCVCVCVYNLIYPFICPIDGHLVCFHVLAVVNTAAKNIGVCVSFGIPGSYGYYFLK